ncbi:NAD(P)H-dependent FMN reductase [Streptosporangium album]|uniref:NAD(P)H-dependent FMN reductase n=2 Tax=Streptosporangium album TaxID=47479 RepID=A0A7W7WCX5_9ACTN|nr:hypothetical protein [Streptosporangium album]MBB4941805.1 NAD(P)H-dependent FMN reductase [Streptosporangium album]
MKIIGMAGSLRQGEHSVLPPQLGHALDWMASRRGGAVLVGKPVAVVTACPRSVRRSQW